MTTFNTVENHVLTDPETPAAGIIFLYCNEKHMKTIINENFEKLDPEKKREIMEESGLYLEEDPRSEKIRSKTRINNEKIKDRGPSAEKNLQNMKN
jgi:hypothetical protein